jgi:peptidoglycan hydrolase-like protein with peptidoglycan-binding domain
MKRLLLAVGVALATLVPGAGAAAQGCASANRAYGPAPLTVTLTANCAGTAFHWDFGDGTSADGQTVAHTFARGTFSVTLTADGAAQPALRTDAFELTLSGPAVAPYLRPVLLRGSLAPRPPGLPTTIVHLYRGGHFVSSAPLSAAGTFRLRTPLRATTPFRVRAAGTVSNPVAVLVRPLLEAHTVGSGAAGEPLALQVAVRPQAAGALRVRVWQGSRLRLDRRYRGAARIGLPTRREGTLRVALTTKARPGFSAASRRLTVHVVLPRLAVGAVGSSVARLAARLRALHYAAPAGSSFGYGLLDGLYAFQKVQDLPRTGVVDAAVWRRLEHPRVPQPRYRSPADHLEIDKAHQVLHVVRGGRISLIVPVSTAGVGGTFTPEGTFAIYRKVTGFDPSPLGTLYDPMYFTGGYAIHGNPSVPPYPASHGCVRVPMWIAPILYATNPYGETVFVY